MTYQAKAADKAQQMITACQQALVIPKQTHWRHLDENEAFVTTQPTAKGTAWEAVIDCNIPNCSVGVIVRKYSNNSMRISWECGFGRISQAKAIEMMAEIMEDNDDIEAGGRAMAEVARRQEPSMTPDGQIVNEPPFTTKEPMANRGPDFDIEPTHFPTVKGLVQPSIEQVAREGFRTTPSTTYEQWDAMRRTLLATVDGYEEVEVRHDEYESAVFYGNDGRVVAHWSQANGHCRCMTPDQVADAIADGVRNYIRNAFRYSNV